MDAYLLRLEAEGGEPLPIDPRQETAVAGHVFQLFGSKLRSVPGCPPPLAVPSETMSV